MKMLCFSLLLVWISLACSFYVQKSSKRPPQFRLFAKNQSSSGKEVPATPTSKPSKLTLGGIVQLILMGAGAPGLGEYKGTDEKGKMFFELEANNLVDSSGNDIQTRAKFFNDGWVEGSDEEIKPPGFFQNLVSGGKLMEEWDQKNRKIK